MGMIKVVIWFIKRYWRNATFRPTLTGSKKRDSLSHRICIDSPLEAQYVRVKEIVSFLTSTIDFITDQLIKGVIY